MKYGESSPAAKLDRLPEGKV